MARPDPSPSRPAGRVPLLSVRLFGILGGVVLALMVLACLGTLPYSMGTADPAGGGQQPRYNAQSLDAYLLPPFWAGMDDEETARLEQHTARIDDSEEAASTRYWLGTDQLGRDFLTRCLAGGAISLGIGIAAAILAVVIGTLYGMVAGFAGGRTDTVMMRVVDVLYGLPYILLVVLLAVALDGLVDGAQHTAFRIQQLAEAGGADAPGGSYATVTDALADEGWWIKTNYWWPGPINWLSSFCTSHRGLINFLTLLMAIGGVSWLTLARVIRGQVLSLKNRPFMEASRALGVPVKRQLFVHILPNLVGPIVVYATLTVPQAILQESFLSFLGIGIRPPLPSWGNLASDGLSQLNPVESRWWLLLWPCVLLGTTLLALNFLGEGLRESLDPKRRQYGGSDEVIRSTEPGSTPGPTA
ncbi:MAG: ABC transporter permease [Planctomycetes bacterium]|nr:ABC transporter permease [Planctomycetota bacterium]NOG52986.1 ABC transporter permease [Planctomycetota bacterium]